MLKVYIKKDEHPNQDGKVNSLPPMNTPKIHLCVEKFSQKTIWRLTEKCATPVSKMSTLFTTHKAFLYMSPL